MKKKKFKFRLQKVLDFRETEKKDRAYELARKNAELRTFEEQVEEILRLQEQDAIPEDGIMTMGEFALHGDYRERLQGELEHQRELVLEAAKAVDAAREAYIEKAVETEALTSVRRKREVQHKEEQQKKERKVINEIVTQRHGRSSKSED